MCLIPGLGVCYSQSYFDSILSRVHMFAFGSPLSLDSVSPGVSASVLCQVLSLGCVFSCSVVLPLE